MKTLVFIIDKPLHGNVRVQEFLDMVMMAAAFDQRVLLVFEGDGVFALLDNQCADAIGLKNITPVLRALDIYDIKDIVVEEESMASRGINVEQLLGLAEALPRCEISVRMNVADHVFNI